MSLTPTDRADISTQLVELHQREKVIERGLGSFIEVGNELIAIKISKLYKAAGHATFEDYCQRRWSIGSSQRQRLMVAAATAETLVNQLEESSPMGELLTPANERQMRPLVGLPTEQATSAWTAAVESAGGEQPTAKQVEEAVQAVTPPPNIDPNTGEIAPPSDVAPPADPPQPEDDDKAEERDLLDAVARSVTTKAEMDAIYIGKAVLAAQNALMLKHSVNELAEALDDDDLLSMTRLAESLLRRVRDIRAARPVGLRVVKGGSR